MQLSGNAGRAVRVGARVAAFVAGHLGRTLSGGRGAESGTTMVRSTERAPTQTVRGRDAELTLLGQHLDQVLSGIGSVVLVEGGAGMGKSRLLGEVAEMARRLSIRDHTIGSRGIPSRSTFWSSSFRWLGSMRLFRSLSLFSRPPTFLESLSAWITALCRSTRWK